MWDRGLPFECNDRIGGPEIKGLEPRSDVRFKLVISGIGMLGKVLGMCFQRSQRG